MMRKTGGTIYFFRFIFQFWYHFGKLTWNDRCPTEDKANKHIHSKWILHNVWWRWCTWCSGEHIHRDTKWIECKVWHIHCTSLHRELLTFACFFLFVSPTRMLLGLYHKVYEHRDEKCCSCMVNTHGQTHERTYKCGCQPIEYVWRISYVYLQFNQRLLLGLITSERSEWMRRHWNTHTHTHTATEDHPTARD